MRGVPIKALVDQLMANADDPNKGRQMGVHWGYKEWNMVSLSSPVATRIPQAVGTAYAAKFKKDNMVCLTSFGDGATSQGEFHSAMNFAGVFKVPVIFFCENNQYAISLPVRRQTASQNIAVKAEAYGFEGVLVDGNDVLAVYKATKAAVDKARSGEAPPSSRRSPTGSEGTRRRTTRTSTGARRSWSSGRPETRSSASGSTW